MGLPSSPNNRKEVYLSNIAGQATALPSEPITREEEYLDYIAKNGGGGGGTGDGDMKKSVYDDDLAVAGAGGIKAYVTGAISGKVDKEVGKGLSTNDYDNTAKEIVDGVTTALNDKQPKTLSEPIVVDGISKFSVETAIDAVNGLAASNKTALLTKADTSTVNAIKDGQSIDSFGDVETALENKTDLSIIFPEFSISKEYTTGDVVIYQGQLYAFITHHNIGAWNSSEVDNIQLKDVIYHRQPSTNYDNDDFIEQYSSSEFYSCDVSLNKAEGSTLYNIVSANTKLIKDTVGWSGKNVLKNTMVNHTSKDVTFAVADDGVISLSGTSSANIDSTTGGYIGNLHNLPNGRYKLTGCPANGSSSTYRLVIVSNATPATYTIDTGEGAEFEVTDSVKWENVFVRINSGVNMTGKVYMPMVRPVDILDSTYEPYHESVKDTLRDAQVIEAENLITLPYDEATSGTGITYTVNDDGSVKLNGTATSAGTYQVRNRVRNPIHLPAGQYMLTGGYSSNVTVTVGRTYNNNWQLLGTSLGNGEVEFTVSAGDDLGVAINITNGTTVNNLVIKPIIHKTNEAVVPLKDSMFTRSEQAVLGAKNLLKNNLISGSGAGTITYTVDDDGVVTINGSHTSGVDLVIESGKNNNYAGMYISSGEDDATKAYLAYQSYEADHTTFISNTIANKNGVIIPNTPYGRVIIHINANQTLTNFKIKPMLRLASDTDPTYVPYAMTNRELTEKKLEVFEINTAVDLNTLTKTGMYLVKNTSTTNRPANTPNQFTLFVMSFSNIFCQQMVVEMTGTKECIYTRRYGGSPEAWSSWYKIEGSAVS